MFCNLIGKFCTLMDEYSSPLAPHIPPTVFHGSILHNLCIPKSKNLIPRKLTFPVNFLESRRFYPNYTKMVSLDSLRNSMLFRGQIYRNPTQRADFMAKVVRKEISVYLETLIGSQMVNFQPFSKFFFFKYNVLR